MSLWQKRVTGRLMSGYGNARRSIGTLFFILPLFLVFAGGTISAGAAPVAAHPAPAVQQTRPVNPLDARLHQMIQEGKMASTVHVVDSQAPTLIEQFPLAPSGLKKAFPNATALVTIVRGDRNDSVSDTITVTVQHMPPNVTFTIFLIELANKPFGNVEYVADLDTRGDGSGEVVFQCIAFVAFSMDARNPGITQELREGPASGVQLEHMGMWFSSLKDAQKVLNDDTLQGTIFDGGNPPLHAGPQAMTDGQTAPVF